MSRPVSDVEGGSTDQGAQFWRSVGFTASGTVTQHLPNQTNLCWRFEKRLGDLAAQEDVPHEM